MKLHKNNRKDKIEKITAFIRDNDSLSENKLIIEYANEIYSQKKKKSGESVDRLDFSSRSYRRVMVDSIERSIGSLAMYYHLNDIKCKLGYFYIISCDSFPSYYKIGNSKDAESRLNVYQTYSPHRDYKLVWYLATNDRVAFEKFAKEYLSDRLNGEWFKSDDIDSDFKSICRAYHESTGIPNRFAY